MKRYTFNPYTRVAQLLLVLALLLIFTTPAFAEGGAGIDKKESITALPFSNKNSTFVHPELGFSFSYPSDWIIENNLSLAHPSGTVSLRKTTPIGDAHEYQVIEIGLHLVESPDNVSISDWVVAYNEAMNLFDEDLLAFELRSISGYPSVYKSAQSPLTPYEVLTIKRGDVIWFIWGNSVGSTEFSKVANSFHWRSDDQYLTLTEMGIHPTMRIDVDNRLFSAPRNESRAGSAPSGAHNRMPNGIPGTPEGYRMPFNVSHPITQGPHSYCYPYSHTGTAAQAIDFSMSQGTYVANSSNGQIERNGWDNQGYGNLVGVQDDSNRIAFYAHLQTRTWRSVNSYIPQSAWIGSSGNTGNSTGPHLHFHVRTTGRTPVDITGIPTMTFNGDGCTGSAWYTP